MVLCKYSILGGKRQPQWLPPSLLDVLLQAGWAGGLLGG